MIILRDRFKILYLHGKDEEQKYPPGNNIIFDELSKWFNIDFAEFSSNPKIGWLEFCKINFSKYDLILGFSMGGLYATCVKDVPVVLINPGIGMEKIWPEFKVVAEEGKKNKNLNVLRIFLGTEDKHKDFLWPETKKRLGEDKIEYMTGVKHVPTKEDVRKYLVGFIKSLK